MANEIELDFYFDPSCRWAWWTSIWIRRLARERPIKVTWKLFSLAVQDNPEDYRLPPARPHHVTDFNLQRALLLARRNGGNDALDRLYIAFGNAIHGSKEDIWDPVVQTRCLEAAGLPPTLFEEALQDSSTETEVSCGNPIGPETRRAWHARAGASRFRRQPVWSDHRSRADRPGRIESVGQRLVHFESAFCL